MPSYTVTVATGSQWFAGTDDYIYLSLVGSAGCSEKHLLDKPFYNDFERGAVDSYEVIVDEELGDIHLIKIEKRKYWLHDDWYLKYITLKTPYGDYMEFPCYRWISGEGELVLRDGRARLSRDDQICVLKQHRRKELETRQKQYRWTEWNPGFPLSIDAKCHKDLPRDIQFDSEKGVDFVLNYSKATSHGVGVHTKHEGELRWKGLFYSQLSEETLHPSAAALALQVASAFPEACSNLHF
uniref:Arachidonate 5-lipoxygenase n=1 Tax=Molossus molossus TaxID=27622 RepID=A0A7J8DNG5_MOLMO|nr:arachidonate 5-lipoxygenase [Molossus molossus]